ncbi:carbohydrate-binding domain-containing protein [Sporosarcina sp. ANT_H38]|uniref:carbohydrate-binding domain-containing protein n=1 Tax=Sporosarcina sp. ANT_H38 TaxID=2597358 RepID=UPI0011F214F7|nr:carbohydrate-binding domain-containing protein [Sporosarcina sp. ANT_H38]KAA0944262.1 carbohydrate-binding domain-containing protein [Sporosarcina sp. ANT_H38]
MKKQNSKFIKVAATLMCTASLFACSNDSEKVSITNDTTAKNESLITIGNQEIASVISEHVTYSDEDFYGDWENETSIQLNGSGASFEGDGGVVIDKSIITIKSSGVYTIQGQLDDGQIIVDTEDKDIVRLVLNGAEIHSSSTSAIYVQQAEKTIVSLEEGTENVLSDGAKYVYENSEEDEPNAALFSKDDLTINGSGKLVVQGNYNDGIASKDQLKITGGTIQINSVDDGLKGKDLLAVKGGTISIEASGDGMKSTNDTDAAKGIIAIEGGSFDIKAADDGIQAETSLLIADGNFNISSGGGSPEKIANAEMGRPTPGETKTSTTDASSETSSGKGLKANVEVAIGGGSFELDSLDDAIHSNNSVNIIGGDLKVASGDDGIHADKSILIEGGSIDITKSNEGIEANSITILDGKIHVKATDDGINISEADENSNTTTEQAEDPLLSINGGYVYVDAAGDGLDSNGSISMTGGTVIVNGPTNNGNGALDYDEDFEISGGVLIAAGSSGMAMATSEDSSQHTILMTYPKTQSAGTTLLLEDSEGNEIVTFAPEKDYQSVVISSPKLTKDASYTLYSGGTTSGKASDGLFEVGDYQDGTKVVEFTISDTITWLDETGITTAKTSGPDGMGGPGGMGAPEGMERPEGMKAPQGMEPPEGMEVPEGMEPPEGMEAPEATEPEGK